MLTEICAGAAGARASPASSAAIETKFLSPLMCDPLEVSTISETARDALCCREEQPGDNSYHKDFVTVADRPELRASFIPTFFNLNV
jgi:hypothetical protein